MNDKHKYSREFIEEIRNKTDLEIIASEYLDLKKTSGWTGDYTALCPFHKEETPSFRIVTRKQMFCCYGCGTNGDVFDFVMRIKGFNFIDSIEYLAIRLGFL